MGIPIISDVIGAVKDLVGKAVVDKDKKLAIELELARLEDSAQARLDGLLLAQTEVNKVEASSGSVFVAGWRPAVGWVGAAALAYSAIVYPLLQWGSRVAGYVGTLPELNDTLLITIMGGMLGLGGMRSWEKSRGVSTNDYRDVPKTPDIKTAPEVEPPKPKKFKL